MQHPKLVLGLLLVTFGAVKAQGVSYALSFSQVRSDWVEGDCVLYINSKEATTVTITDVDGTATENIAANTTFSKYYAPQVRVSSGIEDKGILINAEIEISVMLSNYRDDGNSDTLLVLPLNSDTQEYTIMSINSVNDITCVTGATCSFYSIVAYEDDTTIEVSKLENGQPVLLDTEVLQQRQVYTNRTTNTVVNRNYDFTGYFITADKPVGVNSGNPCADTNINEVAGHAWATMPGDQFARNQYISHTIDYNGYIESVIVRVLALSDDTTVTYSNTPYTIQYRGEYIDFNITSASSFIFECSKPCKAAQFSRNVDRTSPDASAVFMVMLASTNNYIPDTIFNLPETSTAITHYMSIIYLTESPSTNALYFDGVELTGWTDRTGEGFSTLEQQVTGAIEVAHRLISSTGVGFAALIHGQGHDSKGYGFIAGPGISGGDEPSNNITRPSPQYRVDMTGDFASSTGEDFSIQCTDLYSVEMNEAAAEMVVVVDERIGSTLCPSLTIADIKAVSVTTPFLTFEDKGSTELRFILAPDLNRITQGQALSCADEIGTWLLDHDNWRNPIIPTLPGCPGVVFNSRMFNDSGKDWYCLNTQEKPLPRHPISGQQTTLRYRLDHSGLFSTVDGSNLTPGCMADYNTEFDQSTATQYQTVIDRIDGEILCAGTGVDLETVTTSLTGQGNQGKSHQTYAFSLGDSTLAQDVYSCVDAVSAYLAPHSNWALPIIPSVPGCPNVVFDPEVFTEDKQEWLCL